VKLLAALGVTALVLVSGCSKESPPTKEQYSAVADGVCGAAHDDLAAKTKAHLAEGPDGGANQRFVRATVIPALKSMTGSLRGIPAPENDGTYLSDVYSSYDHALDILYTDPLGKSADTATDAVEARLASYGMKACSTAAHIKLEVSAG
jgi:hypothetical protein